MRLAEGLGMRRVPVLVLTLALLPSSACSPAQRRATGATIAALGLVTTYVTVSSAERCTDRHGPNGYRDCQFEPKPLSDDVAAPVALGGLGAVIVGGVLVASGLGSQKPKPPPAVVVPVEEHRELLDADTASGLALARLVVGSVDAKHEPRAILDVSNPGQLRVHGRYAELSGLQVRRAPSGTVETLTVCLEYRTSWRVERIQKRPCAFDP